MHLVLNMFIFTRTLVTYARTIFMPRCCLNFQSMRTQAESTYIADFTYIANNSISSERKSLKEIMNELVVDLLQQFCCKGWAAEKSSKKGVNRKEKCFLSSQSRWSWGYKDGLQPETLADGNWLVKQNQPVSKIETKSDTNLRSLYES